MVWLLNIFGLQKLFLQNVSAEIHEKCVPQKFGYSIPHVLNHTGRRTDLRHGGRGSRCGGWVIQRRLLQKGILQAGMEGGGGADRRRGGALFVILLPKYELVVVDA